MILFKNFINFTIINYKDYRLTVLEIITVTFVFMATKLLIVFIRKFLDSKAKNENLDISNTYSLFVLIKYFLWLAATAIMLEVVKINVTVLLAGSAALLVGIGLGLQQTFNDFFSGIVLLFENTIKVNDVLDIDGDIVRVQDIGLRASRAISRQDISIMIPNSKITTSKVINWSHQSKKTFFSIDIAVSYGSNTEKIIQILKKCASEHKDVVEPETIQIRLVNFGNSSIHFKILFSSEEVFTIEKTKSDIRFEILSQFTKENITIPFPQLDLHLKR